MNQPFVLIKKQDIIGSFTTDVKAGKHPLPLSSAKDIASTIFIMEASGVPIAEAGAEIHKTLHDLFFCIGGEIQFVCGGELVGPVTKEGGENELRSREIKGGTEFTLNPGDWLFIPAGTAHKNGCAGTSRLMVVKIPSSRI